MKKLITSIALVTAAAITMPAIAAYKVVDVANGGSITGKINFTGKDKAPQVYKVAKDTDTCGTADCPDYPGGDTTACLDYIVARIGL